MPATDHDRYRIGDWTLIRSRNLLSGADREHVLEPRAAELLAYLAQRPGEVVPLEALHGDLWAGRIVTDSSIYRLVAELRRLLGDSARAPRYIETVRKRGYRLLAPVAPVGEADNGSASGGSGEPASVPAPTHRPAPDRTPFPQPPAPAAAVLVVLVALAAAIAWQAVQRPPGGAGAAGVRGTRTVLAVLPLERLSPATPPYLADGLARTISDRLAAVPELTVIAYPSVRAKAAADVAPGEVAAALGADLLVSGSVLAAGAGGEGGVRLSLSLVSPDDGVTRWARTFDASLTDVIALHEQLAADVARTLDLALAAPMRAERRQQAAADAATIDAWLHGTSALQAGFQAGTLTEAIAHFDAALERTPDFVPALAARAVAHVRMFANYHDRSDARLALARQDVDRAIDLAPDSADARYAAGYLASLTGSLARAGAELRRALERQPSHAPALMALGRNAARRGEQATAIEHLRAAVEIDPLNAIYRYELGLQQLYYGRFAEAEESLSRAVSRAPEMVEAWLYRAWLQVSWLGDTRAANARLRELRDTVGEDALLRTLLNAGLWGFFTWTEADFDRALAAWSPEESGGDPASWHLAMAEIAFKSGDQAGARRRYAAAAALRAADVTANPSSPWLFAELGIARAGLGEREPALRAVERAMALQPVTADEWDGTDFLWVRATVLAMLGERDAAIAQITDAIRYPSLTTPNALRVDGHWDGVREEAAFRALVAEGGSAWRLPAADTAGREAAAPAP